MTAEPQFVFEVHRGVMERMQDTRPLPRTTTTTLRDSSFTRHRNRGKTGGCFFKKKKFELYKGSKQNEA